MENEKRETTQPQNSEKGIFPNLQATGSNQPSNPAASDLAAKHKSGRGRKPLPRDDNGNIIRKKNISSDSKVSNPAMANIPQAVDPAIIAESVKALLSTVDETVTESVKNSALALTNDVNMSTKLSKKVEMKVAEKEMISKLSANVCLQYNVAGEHANAAFLAIFVVGYTVRVGFALKELKRLELIVSEQNKRGKVNDSKSST